jgi:hypothetical protein
VAPQPPLKAAQVVTRLVGDPVEPTDAAEACQDIPDKATGIGRGNDDIVAKWEGPLA